MAGIGAAFYPAPAWALTGLFFADLARLIPTGRMTSEAGMQARKGEKIGWLVGWMGGFAWVFILSLVFLNRGDVVHGLLGMALTGTATLFILLFAPWRHPSTAYWKLMLAPYGLLLLSVIWTISAFGGLAEAELNPWNLLLLLPLFIPLGSVGRRKWVEDEVSSS